MLRCDNINLGCHRDSSTHHSGAQLPMPRTCISCLQSLDLKKQSMQCPKVSSHHNRHGLSCNRISSLYCACHKPHGGSAIARTHSREIRRRAGGLRFASFSGELGDARLTLTPVLLAAALAFEPPPRRTGQQDPAAALQKGKGQPLERLLARAPQEVCRDDWR